MTARGPSREKSSEIVGSCIKDTKGQAGSYPVETGPNSVLWQNRPFVVIIKVLETMSDSSTSHSSSTPSSTLAAPVTAAQAEQRITAQLAEELGIRSQQVTAVIELLKDGATVPFIARYRKEATGGLDDTVLRNLDTRLLYLRDLEDRRAAILASITEQQKLTPELEKSIQQADTKQRLEDLYAPFKVKRRTRAQIAREAGLEPLADAILADLGCDPPTLAGQYLNPDANIAEPKAALDGARDILAERYAKMPTCWPICARIYGRMAICIPR